MPNTGNMVWLVSEPQRETIRERVVLKSATRIGKRLIGGHFEPSVALRLKQLALDLDTSIQSLLEEALRDLFVKHL